MIYTTYFAKIRSLPSGVLPVAICAKPPVGYKGPVCSALAPKYDFFRKWQITKNNEEFMENYMAQVLKQLNPVKVVADLYSLVGADLCSCDIALVCYEKSTDFCHRHLVADWLYKAGYDCQEFV